MIRLGSEVREEANAEQNHVDGLRVNLAAAMESPKPSALEGIVALDGVCKALALRQLLRWNQSGEWLPVVGVIMRDVPGTQLLEQHSQRGVMTRATGPRDNSTSATA